MAEFNNVIITNKGRELAAKLLTGTQMQFTKAVTSNHKFAVGTDLASVTSIPSIKQTSTINNVTKEGPYSVNVFVNFENKNITVGYDVRVIGLYAKDINGTEILYSISTTDRPDYMPPFNGVTLSTVEYCFITSVSTSENVIVNVYDGNTINRQEFKNHLNDLLPHQMLVDGERYKYGFSQENGFVKLNYEKVV